MSRKKRFSSEELDQPVSYKRRRTDSKPENNVVSIIPTMQVKKQKSALSFQPRNKHQKDLLNMLNDDSKSIIFAIGPAGTGKSYTCVNFAVKLLQEGKVDKIVITRPAVSVDEDLGFLPGTLNEKMGPWTRPIFDILLEYYKQSDINMFLDEGVIEISPLAYMRGRSFSRCIIIADEIQNTTVSQCKMLLTRIGEGSKMVVTGDLNQADRLHNNGLDDFYKKIRDNKDKLKYIDFIEFDKKDVVRHDAVKEVLDLYGED